MLDEGINELVNEHIRRYLYRSLNKIEIGDSRLVLLSDLRKELEQALEGMPGIRLGEYKHGQKNGEDEIDFTIVWDGQSNKDALSFNIYTYYYTWSHRYSTNTNIRIKADEVEVRTRVADSESEPERKQSVNILALSQLISALPAVLGKIPDLLPHYKKLVEDQEMKEKKREKIKSLRHNSARAMLDNFCENLSVPYYIRKMANRLDLCLKLPDSNLVLAIEIPLTKFQDIMPELSDMIEDQLRYSERYKAKTLIMHEKGDTYWENNS
jgi:hypothetical protein